MTVAAGGQGQPGLPSGPAESATLAGPAWLKPEVFDAADFNPEACIADLRRFVSGRGPPRAWRAIWGERGRHPRAPPPPPPPQQVPRGPQPTELEEYSSSLRSQVGGSSSGGGARALACAQTCVPRVPPTPTRLPPRTASNAGRPWVCVRPQLIEVVNQDYNDYVSLSTRLVNVDGAVLRMRKPLEDLQASDAAGTPSPPPQRGRLLAAGAHA